MTLKEYLHQARGLEKLIKARKGQLQQLQDTRSSISAMATPDKVQTSPTGDRMAGLTAAILDLADLLAADLTKLLRLKYDIELMIETLPSAQQRLIMTERYVSLKHWEDIAADNNVSWNTVHRVHSAALHCLHGYYQKFTGQGS